MDIAISIDPVSFVEDLNIPKNPICSKFIGIHRQTGLTLPYHFKFGLSLRGSICKMANGS